MKKVVNYVLVGGRIILIKNRLKTKARAKYEDLFCSSGFYAWRIYSIRLFDSIQVCTPSILPTARKILFFILLPL